MNRTGKTGLIAAGELSELYAATLISSAIDIRALSAKASHLLVVGRESTRHPDFYLASVSPKSWKPQIVEVTYNHRVVGIVYAKERLLAGRPTGIIYADTILGLNIVAEPAHREEVLIVAIRFLQKSKETRALRLLVRQDGLEYSTVLRIASSLEMEMASIPIEKHSHLSLPSSYEDFLNNLGARTRRNFRYYRRRFETMGRQYRGKVASATFRSAVWQLKDKSSIAADVDSIERALKMLSAVDKPLLIGLQAPDGEWLAVAGGWCENSTATLILQMNHDQEYHRDSLSQILRSYLIEQLIESGIRELIFWAGTSAPLVRYAQRIPARAIYLDSRKASWRLFRMLVASLAPRLPRPFMQLGIWITPSGGYSEFD